LVVAGTNTDTEEPTMTATQTEETKATAGYTLEIDSELTRRIETKQFATRNEVEDFLWNRGTTRTKQYEIFSRGRIEVGYTLYTLTGPSVPVPVNYGDRRISYMMDPINLAGRSINHGFAYANADTVERAREWANGVVNGSLAGEVVASVEVYGEEREFLGDAWHLVKGGYRSHETVKRTAPIEFDAIDRAKACEWNSSLEDILHETRGDGSCKCGLCPSRFSTGA
jgi:hypothetical protein